MSTRPSTKYLFLIGTDIPSGHTKMLSFCSDALSLFNENSVLFVPSAFSPEFCSKAREYILDNEPDIISKYSSDKRGLVCEKLEGVNHIKYFEYPLHFDSLFFGQFLTSTILNTASVLLQDDVRFVSAEIHSRFPLASEIPPHQDNAYYGLVDGKAVTFYIALDSQVPNEGGLQYLNNPINNELAHITSSKPGFSLEIANKAELSTFSAFLPTYSPGDCTIHHSRSIHFASPVPQTSHRSLVFRFSFYSASSFIIPGHLEKYRQAIDLNRSNLL